MLITREEERCIGPAFDAGLDRGWRAAVDPFAQVVDRGPLGGTEAHVGVGDAGDRRALRELLRRDRARMAGAGDLPDPEAVAVGLHVGKRFAASASEFTMMHGSRRSSRSTSEFQSKRERLGRPCAGTTPPRCRVQRAGRVREDGQQETVECPVERLHAVEVGHQPGRGLRPPGCDDLPHVEPLERARAGGAIAAEQLRRLGEDVEREVVTRVVQRAVALRVVGLERRHGEARHAGRAGALDADPLHRDPHEDEPVVDETGGAPGRLEALARRHVVPVDDHGAVAPGRVAGAHGSIRVAERLLLPALGGPPPVGRVLGDAAGESEARCVALEAPLLLDAAHLLDRGGDRTHGRARRPCRRALPSGSFVMDPAERIALGGAFGASMSRAKRSSFPRAASSGWCRQGHSYD